MNLVWSRAAVADLEEVAAYIAEESERIAEFVEARIHEEAALLARFPDAGRQGRVSGTRERVVLRTPYIIVYRKSAGRVHPPYFAGCASVACPARLMRPGPAGHR